jgi:very-short-patch-repair endonuclease
MRRELRVALQSKGLTTTQHLLDAGLSSGAIARRVKDGRLHHKHRGVYAIGRPDLPPEAEMWAAALALGEDAVISHTAAAWLWGFWEKQPTPPFDVTVPRRARRRAGIRVHQATTLTREDWTWWRGVPVTTVARTLDDLARTLSSVRPLTRAVHEAESLGRISHEQLQRTTTHPRLARIVAPGPRPTRSELEDRVDALLTRHGLRAPHTNTRIDGLPRWVVVDFYFPKQRLVIEADGQYHDTPIRQRSDRRKQAILEAHGLRVLRLRDEDTKPETEAQTVVRVRHALRAR